MDRIHTGERKETAMTLPPRDMPAIRSYMEQHFHLPLSVGQLAEMAGLSRKYFVDLFSKTYGQSAISYLTDLRINRAKIYLAEQKYRLREIAQMVGYSDEFYFSRKFKQEVGVSPSVYAGRDKRRIASCSSFITGHLLALGIIPVAAPLDSKWTPYYYNVYQHSIEYHLGYVGTGSFGDLTKLVKSRPDAIIAPDSMEEQKNQLEEIAPSLIADSTVHWKEQLTGIAEFVGCRQLAEQWLDRFQQKLNEAKQRLIELPQGEDFMVLRIYGRQMFAYSNRAISELLYGRLGLAPAYGSGQICNEPLSGERLSAIDPDRILVLVCPERESRRYWLELQHQKEWKALSAVSAGQLYSVPSDPWCECSAIAMDRMLDELLLLLTGYCPNGGMDILHGGESIHPV